MGNLKKQQLNKIKLLISKIIDILNRMFKSLELKFTPNK